MGEMKFMPFQDDIFLFIDGDKGRFYDLISGNFLRKFNGEIDAL